MNCVLFRCADMARPLRWTDMAQVLMCVLNELESFSDFRFLSEGSCAATVQAGDYSDIFPN